MNRKLQDAILGTFQARPAEGLAETLTAFPAAAWQESYRWLDASGLALYFLDRVKCLRLEACLPEVVLQRLERNSADNRERTADTFRELVRINRAFTAAGVTFVNVKGISLVPHACVDPGLRLQLDLDFLIEMREVQACAVALSAMGYALTAVSGDVWEFHSDAASMPSIDDLYKAKPQRTVEVHFATGSKSVHLTPRAEPAVWEAFSFPVMDDVERFVAQATHVLKHVRGEWTRLSWLLEFRQSVLYWAGDHAFWQRVRERAGAEREVGVAIGTAVVLATIAFGEFAPEELVSWSVDTLDQRMRLWLECYGREAIMADFPGTKLYLLQPEPAGTGDAMHPRVKRSRLMPLHGAPKVVHGTGDAGFRSRMRGFLAQGIFFSFRLRFHVAEGYRYLIEAPRWKKALAAAQEKPSALRAASNRGSL